MLDFDILDTVAGRQVYDEGIEKGIEKRRKEEREEGLSNMKEMLEFNLKNKFKNGFFVMTQGGGKINLEHVDIKAY